MSIVPQSSIPVQRDNPDLCFCTTDEQSVVCLACIRDRAAGVRWSDADRDEWADACARDAERESGGGW